MSASEIPRRPSRLSKLKTLPEEKQAQVIAWLKSPAGGPGTVDLIREHWQIETSDTALSDFWSWWHLQRQFSQNEARVESFLERLATKRPEIPAEEMFSLGQEMFSALAIEQQDAKTWASIQKLQQNTAALDLDRRKFQRETCELFLKWSQDARARDIAGSSAPNAEKIEQLGAVIFGDLWK